MVRIMAAKSPGSTAPRVGIVTVSYHSGEVLAGFLDSVRGSSAVAPVVVVVDNLREAEVENLAASVGARYLSTGSNLGYGGAMNAGVSTLDDDIEWVLLSNPDVLLTAGVIDALVAVAESDDSIAAVGPAVLNADGSVYPSARNVPSLRTGVGHALFANLWISNPWSAAYKNESADNTARRDAGWLSGSCLLVRRTAFATIGGFDDGYFMYFEDVDLGYRFGKAGLRNVYEPSVGVTHTGAHSTTSESDRMVAAHHESARRFLSKKYPGVLLWPIRVTLTIGLALRSAVLRRRITRESSHTA
jgi:N-acetylglucosaminyl-diphospho-decaprenol L-rhamnosyltransferase